MGINFVFNFYVNDLIQFSGKSDVNKSPVSCGRSKVSLPS